MKSLGAMIKQLAGMLGTDDLSTWEQEFIDNIDGSTAHGEHTFWLTAKQASIVESLYKKHFGDAD